MKMSVEFVQKRKPLEKVRRNEKTLTGEVVLCPCVHVANWHLSATLGATRERPPDAITAGAKLREMERCQSEAILTPTKHS
jgi:hypothetical protein